MFYVRPLKILQHTFECLQTNTLQPWNLISQEVSHNVLDAIEKCDWFLICFLKILGYFVKCQILQQYLNNQGIVFKTSCKLRRKKTECCCKSLNVWIITHAMFPAIPKQGCFLGGLYEVYSSVLQHIWCVTVQTFASLWMLMKKY